VHTLAEREQMALSLPRHPSTVAYARGILSVLLTSAGTTDDRRDELAVIITEACTNAIVHSTPDSPVDIRVNLGDGECTLDVGNQGDAINAEAIGQRATRCAPEAGDYW
jgi:serine/threonine-protein kinase RsbW